MPAHSHSYNHRAIHPASGTQRALLIAFTINAVFLIVEFIGGLLTNSLALMADAGHMLTDVGALLLALIAGKIAMRPPSAKRTYGYGRAKVISALLNGLSLWLIVGVIIWEAVHRFYRPPEVDAVTMLYIAVIGLTANLASAAVLWKHHGHDINIKGAFLHLAGDSLGSIGVILAGIAMIWKGWYIVDPAASLLISVIILATSWGVIRHSLRILLESAPPEVKFDQVKVALERIDGVRYCHDLHIWMVGSDEPVLTAHLVVDKGISKEEVLSAATCMIVDKFEIRHSTLQIESSENHTDMGCRQG